MAAEVLGDAFRGLIGAPPRTARWPGPTPRVAILGTGFAGIGAGIVLRRAGIETFTIFEKADGVGGTWRDNTYPGAACDVPSHLYSFSFESNHEWSRKYSPQPEILAYLERTTDEYGLRGHIRFRTAVASLRWDDEAGVWHLRTEAGEELEFDAVISGLGQLNQPAFPDVPGRDEFAGTSFHSARWDHGHDLAGERVAVIGNGASAVQFVPEIQPRVAHLYQFQRSANYVLPKPEATYSDARKWAYRHVPGVELAYRKFIYLTLEARFCAMHRDSKLAPLVSKAAAAFRSREVADPELRAKLTPDYPPGCKRILISNDYYRALVAPNAEVVDTAVERITPHGIVTADGVEREVDTIIYSTGFRTTSFLTPLAITGRHGRRLEDAWRDGAEAYYGITVAGFPNLFLCYGPNTNLGHNSIVFMIEAQLRYTVACLRAAAARGAAWCDVRPGAMAAYNAGVQEAVHGTVWEAGCDSWYKNAAGKVTNNWPRSTVRYWWDTQQPDLAAYDFGGAVPVG